MRIAVAIITKSCIPHKISREVKKLLWLFYLKYIKIWHVHVDYIYILDHQCGLSVLDCPSDLRDKIIIINNDAFPNHYESLERFFKIIASKNNEILITEPDFIIYDSTIVEKGFSSLKKYDVASIFSVDGCKVRNPGSIFEKNNWRNWRGKIANWCCFCHGKWMKNVKFFPVKWENYFYDPLTETILENNGKILEVPEDCWQLLCNEDGKLYEEWSEHSDATYYQTHKDIKNLGYYHILRSSHIWKFVTDSFEPTSFLFYEKMRLGAWAYLITEIVDPKKTGMFEETIKKYPHFLNYYAEFKKYHSPILDAIDFSLHS